MSMPLNNHRLQEFERQIADRYLDRILELVTDGPLVQVRMAFAATGLNYDQLRSERGGSIRYDLYGLLHELNRDECCPGICLRFGLARDLLDLGVLGYAVLSCRDLGMAMQVIAKFHHLTSNAFAMAITEEGSWTVARQWIKPQYARWRVVIDEEHVTGIWRVISSLLHADPGMGETRIEFAHSEPKYGGLYRDLLGCTPVFGAPETLIAFPTAWLNKPVHTADHTVEQVCESQCDQLVDQLRPAGDLVDNVRRLILTVPPNCAPKLDEIASKMLTSARTLERRLHAAGTTFRKIDNEVRMQLAAQYLALGYMSAKEIAYMLGYSQPGTFHRAFKNWYGVAPGVYREEVVGTVAVV
jgi:AraC-like DNA-binding protein